jgi:hypothetical protein
MIVTVAKTSRMKSNYFSISALRGRSRRSKAVIIPYDHHVLLELGLHDLCSYATPVVLKLMRKGTRKKSTAPTRSTRTIVRDKCRSSRFNCPPNIGFASRSRQGELTVIAADSCRMSHSLSRLSCPGRFYIDSNTV